MGHLILDKADHAASLVVKTASATNKRRSAPLPDIAQTCDRIFGKRRPPIVFTFKSLGHWRSGTVTLSEDKSTNTTALNVNCAA
jgi:hypothetical protein